MTQRRAIFTIAVTGVAAWVLMACTSNTATVSSPTISIAPPSAIAHPDAHALKSACRRLANHVTILTSDLNEHRPLPMHLAATTNSIEKALPSLDGTQAGSDLWDVMVAAHAAEGLGYLGRAALLDKFAVFAGDANRFTSKYCGFSEAATSSAGPNAPGSNASGPMSLCQGAGPISNGVIDYAAPSPGAKQSQEEALARFNKMAPDKTYVMEPEGWAVARDESGEVLGIAVFEEQADGYWAVGSEIDCS